MPPHNLFLGIVTTALGAMAIYKHKSNIQRLMAGTENRLGKKIGGHEMKITCSARARGERRSPKCFMKTATP